MTRTTTYLATFVVKGKDSDTEAINHAVSMLDFIPIAQAANLHVFLIRSEKTFGQLRALFAECLDPEDFSCLIQHPAPETIAKTLQEALAWVIAD